jgi:hypothetical protein
LLFLPASVIAVKRARLRYASHRLALRKEDTMSAERGGESQMVGDAACLGADLIWGVKGIAAELKFSERRAQHLVDSRQIPTGKVGGKIVGSRAALRQHFAKALGGEGG